MRILSFIALLVFAVAARGEERLVTSSGKHTAKDGKISVQIATPDSDHVNFRVDWEQNKTTEGGLKILSTWSESSNEPFAVVAGRWAFCFVGQHELWFYDGVGAFYRYKGTADGLSSSASCSDPNLGKRAPRVLKKWIKGKASPKR